MADFEMTRRVDPEGMTRRGMLGTAAAAAALLAGPAFGARKIAASDRVNIAVIGAGGQGAANM